MSVSGLSHALVWPLKFNLCARDGSALKKSYKIGISIPLSKRLFPAAKWSLTKETDSNLKDY